MSLIPASKWQEFSDIMRAAHDTFEQKTVTWKRLNSGMDRFGEDTQDNLYDTIDLKVQLNYNYMRSWPITQRTETGDLDRESVQLLVNKRYLAENGWINADGYFAYNMGDDYFLINGLKHVPMGDTMVSQAYDDDILFSIILKRDETPTGTNR